MIQYRIPNLLNLVQPYIKPINPNYDVLEAECIAWIDASPVLSDAHKKGMKDSDLAFFTSKTYPDSTLGQLRVATEYLAESLFIELLTDAPATATQAQRWANIYTQAFKQTLGEVEGPAVLIKYLTDRLLSAVKDPYQRYIVTGNMRLAQGVVQEATDRQIPPINHTLEEYLQTRRRATVDILPFLALGRWMQDLDISPEVLEHPDILKLEEQTADLVSLANDLYSYKREFLEVGAHHNYVTVALSDPITGLHENDRQGAINYTYHKFSETLADFQRRAKTLPSLGESEDAKIALYIGVMIDLFVGNIQWSLFCRRYGHLQRPEAPNWGDVVFDMDPL